MSSFLLEIRISPNASRSRLLTWHEKQLKVAIAAPAVDNKANLELIRFISKQLHLSKSSIQLVKGAKSKNKVIEIQGIDEQLALDLLNKAIEKA